MSKIKEKIIKSKAIKFEVFDGKKKIVRAYLYLIKNDLHKRPYGLLEDIYIDEKYRGRGIGSHLLKEVINKAKKLKCYKLIATSRFERKNVHKWYLKAGFKKYGYEFRFDIL
ncbi:MAG: hypothetical protein KatS3mg095_0911 [Candidatus Parcubacteria bacterium]|nr:MAG: hypothetical protein KatS3mg095_0911 [Candidatus Parcubacteria bacterium]